MKIKKGLNFRIAKYDVLDLIAINGIIKMSKVGTPDKYKEHPPTKKPIP